jgi:AcrR family transcriptional regulator
MYRYFGSKEQLVYETVIRLLEEWNAEQRRIFIDITGTGLERLGNYLHALVSLIETRKPLLALMGEFDFVFRDDLGFHPDAETTARFAEAARLGEDLMAETVRAGILDGSVAPHTDAAIVVPTISSVLWGTAQRVAIRDRMIREEYGYSGAELIRAQIDLYLRALSARA